MVVIFSIGLWYTSHKTFCRFMHTGMHVMRIEVFCVCGCCMLVLMLSNHLLRRPTTTTFLARCTHVNEEHETKHDCPIWPFFLFFSLYEMQLVWNEEWCKVLGNGCATTQRCSATIANIHIGTQININYILKLH